MAMAAWSARSPASFFSSCVNTPRRPNTTTSAPTARSWWISGSAMHACRSLVSASARRPQRGSRCTSSMYSGWREASTAPAMVPWRGAGAMRKGRPASSGPAQKLPPSRRVSAPWSTQTYAIRAFRSVVAASAIPRNAASLSAAEVISRVRRLRLVSRSARSSACRSVWPWRSGTARARFAGLGRGRLLNGEVQSCVCLAEGVLDGGGRLGAGEDEPEILPALEKRHHRLPGVHRDRDFVDAFDLLSVVGATDRDEPAGPRDRDHHDAGGASLALERFERTPERVRKDQVLEGQTGAERQGAGAEASDRARGHLEHERAALVQAKLRVDGALGEPERRARVAAHRGDTGLDGFRQTRRRHVDRLLEERAVERIGLVEDRQHVQCPAEQ